MTQCNYPEAELERETETKVQEFRTLVCPSCGEAIQTPADQVGELVHELSGLPAGVKFDPTDQEILEHLEAKVLSESGGGKLHPLIDEFIPTLETPNGICYTHPENLPGVSKDSQVRHFFNRPSKAYTTGSRKRRRVQGEEDGSETRWHKTGRTRPISCDGMVKGFKKILVLYTNYGRKRKPQKTNWVMHQYHIGANEEEKDGQLVVSKVFYQKQPRPSGLVTGSGSGSGILRGPLHAEGISDGHGHDLLLEYHDKPPFICYEELGNIIPVGLVPCLGGEGHTSSASATSKAKGPC